MSSNVVNISEEYSFSKMLKSLAEKSFKKEKVLYDNLGIEDVETLYNKFKSDYNSIQNSLIKNIFGENYSFLISFCDNDFIHKIVTTGKNKIQKTINNLNEIAEYIRRGNKENPKSGGGLYTISESFAQTRLEKIRELSQYVFDQIYESITTGDNPIIKIDNEEIKDDVENQLIANLEEAFLEFDYRYIKEGKAAEKEEDNKTYQTISLIKQEDSVKILRKDGVKKILFNKTELISIINTALKNLQSKYRKSTKDITFNLSVSNNEILIKFQALEAEPLNKNKDKKEIIAEAFYDTVYNFLPNDQQNAFYRFWGKGGGKINFINLGAEKLYKLLTASTESLVSGELGETMVSIFLKTLPKKQEEMVYIFGQTKGDTGDAAVDIGLKYASQKIGFQVKNYSSIDSEMVLYPQSNDLMADDILRYITTEQLNQFRMNIQKSLYWSNLDPIKKDKGKEEEEYRKNENLNILQDHIQYYLRYDEAEGAAKEIEGYQNNFYVLNFKIIPASVLFLLLAEIVKSEEKNIKNGDQVFFMTSQKQEPTEGNLLSKQNFKESYEKIVTSASQTVKPENVVEISLPQNYFYINFTGIKVEFKNAIQVFL